MTGRMARGPAWTVYCLPLDCRRCQTRCQCRWRAAHERQTACGWWWDWSSLSAELRPVWSVLFLAGVWRRGSLWCMCLFWVTCGYLVSIWASLVGTSLSGILDTSISRFPVVSWSVSCHLDLAVSMLMILPMTMHWWAKAYLVYFDVLDHNPVDITFAGRVVQKAYGEWEIDAWTLLLIALISLAVRIPVKSSLMHSR